MTTMYKRGHKLRLDGSLRGERWKGDGRYFGLREDQNRQSDKTESLGAWISVTSPHSATGLYGDHHFTAKYTWTGLLAGKNFLTDNIF